MDKISLLLSIIILIGLFFVASPEQKLTGMFISNIQLSACGYTNGVYPTSLSLGSSSGACSFPGNSGVYFKVYVPSSQQVTVNPNIQSTASCQTAVHLGDTGVDTPFTWENNAPWQVSFSASQGWYTILLICWQGGTYNLQVTGSGGTNPPPAQQSATSSYDYNSGATTNTFASSSGGSVPTAMADKSSATWVQGGLAAPGGDYQGSYTVKIGNPLTLNFYAQVECISGSCGGYTGCGYYFKLKNQNTGQWDDIDNLWVTPGIWTKPNIVVSNPSQYADANGYAEVMFSFECNMNGKVLDFKPTATYAAAQPQSYCGDYTCDAGENCATCPTDCGQCTKSTGQSCSSDYECSSYHCVHNICRSSSAYCGDTYCDNSAGESCGNCETDCGECEVEEEEEPQQQNQQQEQQQEQTQTTQKQFQFKYYLRSGIFSKSLKETTSDASDVFRVTNAAKKDYEYGEGSATINIESKMEHSWYWIYSLEDTGSGYAAPEYQTFLPPGQERTIDLPMQFYVLGGNEINVPMIRAEYACSLNAIDSILATAPGSPFDGLPPDLLSLFSGATGITTEIDANTFFEWMSDHPKEIADALDLDEAAIEKIAGSALKVLKLWSLLDKLGENIWAPVQEELYVQVMAE